MSPRSNADVLNQPVYPASPQQTPESYPRSRIQSESEGFPNPKPVHTHQDGSTAASSAVSRTAWSPLSIFKWSMFKKKREPLVGERQAYLWSVKPGSAAFRFQSDQDELGGGLRASRASAARFEKRNTLLRNSDMDDRKKSHGGSQEKDLHPSNPWFSQATANRQAENADRAKTSPRLRASQPSRTQDIGNGAAAGYAASEWSMLNTGNDHLRFGEHKARLEASYPDASLLEPLFKQEQQDLVIR